MRRFLLPAAAVVALVLAAAPAHAQRFRVPGVGGTLNPYNYYDPYGYSRQAAFNLALYGRAMQQVPPYALGYSPYPQVINYGPVYRYGYYGPGYLTPYGPLYTPYWHEAPAYYGY
jgi:hypothetical protein